MISIGRMSTITNTTTNTTPTTTPITKSLPPPNFYVTSVALYIYLLMIFPACGLDTTPLPRFVLANTRTK